MTSTRNFRERGEMYIEGTYGSKASKEPLPRRVVEILIQDQARKSDLKDKANLPCWQNVGRNLFYP